MASNTSVGRVHRLPGGRPAAVLVGHDTAPRTLAQEVADCTCVVSCADHPPTACSLSGIPHVHPDDGSGTFGPCPVHPDAPGDH